MRATSELIPRGWPGVFSSPRRSSQANSYSAREASLIEEMRFHRASANRRKHRTEFVTDFTLAARSLMTVCQSIAAHRDLLRTFTNANPTCLSSFCRLCSTNYSQIPKTLAHQIVQVCGHEESPLRQSVVDHTSAVVEQEVMALLALVYFARSVRIYLSLGCLLPTNRAIVLRVSPTRMELTRVPPCFG